MTATPFPRDQALTDISLAFMNRRFIADEALPRSMVAARSYSYSIYDFEEGFLLQDDTVGRRSAPNEIEFHAKEATGTTLDRALDDLVPVFDSDEYRGAEKQLHGRASERITNLIALNREKRVADKILDPNTYPASNKETLAAGESFAVFDTSDPIEVISQALDVPVMRPNTMVIGRKLFNFVSRHPKVMVAVNGTSGDSGIARRQQIAEIFELDKVLVGEGFYIQNQQNVDAPQDPVRLWKASLALYYLDQIGGPAENPSFGFTAQTGQRFVGKAFDSRIGMRGGYRVRVGETLDEQICAARLGYLIQDPTAEAA